jgi:O-6-methylguanine DNA methyltransferase
MKAPTDFEKRLYKLLTAIPRGKVVTYGTLAEMLGNRGFARAVGNALHKNPDGEKYPCYKVVNAKGALAPAFVFGGIEEQKRRLEAEGIEVKDGRVDLEKYGYTLF